MRDPDGMREAMVLSGQPAADLAADQGKRWTTEELQREFTVLGFASPFVVVTRNSDGVKGSLEFSGRPRVYYGFKAA